MRYHEVIAAASVAETSLVKPKGPLTPTQAAREAERKAKIQKQISDQQNASAKKLADLRAELTRHPS